MIPINTASNLFSKLKVPLPRLHDVMADLGLKLGDVVEGHVLKQSSPGNIMLLIQGKKIRAHTQVPLKPGMRLTLKFSSDIGMPTLKIIDTHSPRGRALDLGAIRAALDDNIWANIYESLDDPLLSPKDRKDIKILMEKIYQMTRLRPGGECIKALVDLSGLAWENKFARMVSGMGPDTLDTLVHGDLKGLISKVLMDPLTSETMLKPFIEALDNIQLLNLPGSDHTRSVFLPLPLSFDGGAMGLAQILLQFPRENGSASQEVGEKESDRQYSLLMLLEMSSLGAIRAELVLKGKKIQGRFMVDRKATAESIETHLSSFSSMLVDRGFTVGYMGCQVADTEIVTQSPVEEIVTREGSSVCFVA
ncbi:flagellar hook-length control protein FliK [Desulfocicer niacini]